MKGQSYYKIVADHYNREAESYEERLQPNKTLQKIRDDFRQVVQKHLSGTEVLDFGCGTGSDLCYFAGKYPDKHFTGLDLSEKMIEASGKKIESENRKNVQLQTGTIFDIREQKFDFIYIFFGALNTVHDLNEVVENLYACLNNHGKILVTFVNKWYPVGMLAYVRRLKFGKAFERLKKIWWGYSEKYLLESKTYYGRQILKSFNKFDLIYKRGYSIVYPAWYQDRIASKLGSFANKLWHLDEVLSKSVFWSWGDYVLFVFEKKQ